MAYKIIDSNYKLKGLEKQNLQPMSSKAKTKT